VPRRGPKVQETPPQFKVEESVLLKEVEYDKIAKEEGEVFNPESQSPLLTKSAEISSNKKRNKHSYRGKGRIQKKRESPLYINGIYLIYLLLGRVVYYKIIYMVQNKLNNNDN